MDWNALRLHALEEKEFNALPDGQEQLRVVGVSFVEGYPENLHSLAKLHVARERHLDLVRNPKNQYDKNAVEVRYNGDMLGHLSKDVAARIAPKLDNGDSHRATVHQILVNPDNPEHPGLDILVEWLPK